MIHFVMGVKHTPKGIEIVEFRGVFADAIDAYQYLLITTISQGLIYVVMSEDGVTREYIRAKTLREDFVSYGNILLELCNPEVLLDHYKETLKDLTHYTVDDYLCKVLRVEDCEITLESELDAHYYEFIKENRLLEELK